jgi:hypothetical protein
MIIFWKQDFHKNISAWIVSVFSTMTRVKLSGINFALTKLGTLPMVPFVEGGVCRVRKFQVITRNFVRRIFYSVLVGMLALCIVSLARSAKATGYECKGVPTCVVILLDRTLNTNNTTQDVSQLEQDVGNKLLEIFAGLQLGIKIAIGQIQQDQGGVQGEIITTLTDLTPDNLAALESTLADIAVSSYQGSGLQDIFTAVGNEFQQNCNFDDWTVILLSDNFPTLPPPPDPATANLFDIVSVALDTVASCIGSDGSKFFISSNCNGISDIFAGIFNIINCYRRNTCSDFVCDDQGICQFVLHDDRCPSADVCKVGTCSPFDPNAFSDGCVFTITDANCCMDDADCQNDTLCDGQESCVNNQCQQGTPPVCEDNNTCTDDSCDPKTGCHNADNHSCDPPPCSDRDRDGVCDDADNCPDTANPDQTDGDGNGVGNACDHKFIAKPIFVVPSADDKVACSLHKSAGLSASDLKGELLCLVLAMVLPLLRICVFTRKRR